MSNQLHTRERAHNRVFLHLNLQLSHTCCQISESEMSSALYGVPKEYTKKYKFIQIDCSTASSHTVHQNYKVSLARCN